MTKKRIFGSGGLVVVILLLLNIFIFQYQKLPQVPSDLRGIVVPRNTWWMPAGDWYETDISTDSPYETDFTLIDVLRIKESGATHIELHGVFWEYVTTDVHVLNEVFFERWLDVWVNWCEIAGIGIIINPRPFHAWEEFMNVWGPRIPPWMWRYYGYPDDWWRDGIGDPMQEQADLIHDFFDLECAKMEPCRETYIQFWEALANRYKDRPHVWFGLINEPMHHTYQYMSPERSEHLGASYSQLMDRTIEAIRATGFNGYIFVDRPYLRDIDHIAKIERDDFVWECHAYIWPEEPTLESWKEKIDVFVDKFVHDFEQPLYIGEYGIDPPSFRHNLTDWKETLAGEVEYMKTLPITGRCWHSYLHLYSEYTSDEDVEYIKNVIFSKRPRPFLRELIKKISSSVFNVR